MKVKGRSQKKSDKMRSKSKSQLKRQSKRRSQIKMKRRSKSKSQLKRQSKRRSKSKSQLKRQSKRRSQLKMKRRSKSKSQLKRQSKRRSQVKMKRRSKSKSQLKQRSRHIQKGGDLNDNDVKNIKYFVNSKINTLIGHLKERLTNDKKDINTNFAAINNRITQIENKLGMAISQVSEDVKERARITREEKLFEQQQEPDNQYKKCNGSWIDINQECKSATSDNQLSAVAPPVAQRVAPRVAELVSKLEAK